MIAQDNQIFNADANCTWMADTLSLFHKHPQAGCHGAQGVVRQPLLQEGVHGVTVRAAQLQLEPCHCVLRRQADYHRLQVSLAKTGGAAV
jgi:hypothetical protein